MTGNQEKTNKANGNQQRGGECADRRRFSRALALGALTLAGCGGGGASTATNPPAGEPGSEPTGNAPPARGIFGGGQGKILFVERDLNRRQLMELDLATRSVRGVASIDQAKIFGGITRANDGAFLLSGDDSRMSAPNIAVLYGPDASLRRTFDLESTTTSAAALSPDGRSIVYAGLRFEYGATGPDYVLFAAIIDVQTGGKVSTVVLGLGDAPVDKTTVGAAAQAVWTPDSKAFVAIPGGLYQINRGTAVATKVQEMEQSSAVSIASSPDGREIWYESDRGSPVGACLWSINIETGEKKQRSVRSDKGRQQTPGFSPDGKWLLMTQGRVEYDGLGVLELDEICAIRLTEVPLNTANLDAFVVDSSGKAIDADGRMVWY